MMEIYYPKLFSLNKKIIATPKEGKGRFGWIKPFFKKGVGSESPAIVAPNNGRFPMKWLARRA
jgi:hypothetical protein